MEACLRSQVESASHADAGVWMSEESVGDAGATNLGYFTGCFSPEGRSILAHGFTGALHLWTRPGHSPNSCALACFFFLAIFQPVSVQKLLLFSKTVMIYCT